MKGVKLIEADIMKKIWNKMSRDRRSIKAIEKSGTFDHCYYRMQADRMNLKINNPISHYVRRGWKLGLNPHILFNTEAYLKHNPDVKASNVNAFAHYLEYGYFEDRNLSDSLTIKDYVHFNPELASSLEHPLTHYNRVYSSKAERTPAAAEVDQYFTRAVEGGYFDFKWYLDTYNKFFPNPLEAFSHYLRVAHFSPVNPSPGFDSVGYYRSNMDVYLAGLNPLTHYLDHKDSENRSIGKHECIAPSRLIVPPLELTDAANKLRIAFCLHIFYLDYVDLFASALENFPLTIDLYVAVSNQEIADLVTSRFQLHVRVNSLVIKVAPNQGRNFGPLLVEFSKDLHHYDILCHLHSKKSLYSGREQYQWARYLIEYLVSDPSVVTRALNIFASGADVGIYCPTTFWLMPPWVNHVLRNRSSMQFWADMFDMKIENDFLAYPVGGMFWARPSAIKDLLEKRFEYSDFPQEPLPNDGSILHGLERILGILAAKNGYRQIFYYPECGQFSEDQDYIFSAYQHGSDMMSALETVDCISFDLFDTLVRREYTVPDYAKLKLGKEVSAKKLTSSPTEFVEIRNRTEGDLRALQGYTGDVAIDDIYKAMMKALDINENQAAYLMEREFEIDLEMMQAKEEMVGLFNAQVSKGKTIWIISDTYYLKSQITQILRKIGISGVYRLLISSETGLRKDNGTMWARVKKDLAASGVTNYIHVGDNVVADAQLPGDVGLRTLHVLHPLDKWQALGFTPVLKSQTTEEANILKWGKLVSRVGRYPWLSY